MEKKLLVAESCKNDKYQDILETKWPPKQRFHPQMNLQERAKIFLPFAALKGFEEAIEEKRRLSEIASEPKYTKLED